VEVVVLRKKPRASGVLQLELLQARGRHTLASAMLSKPNAAGTQAPRILAGEGWQGTRSPGLRLHWGHTGSPSLAHFETIITQELWGVTPSTLTTSDGSPFADPST